MKILLVAINARYIHANPAVFSLKACAGAYASCVDIVEFTINEPPSRILREIYQKRPDVTAFSCYIWNRTLTGQIIRDLRKILPDMDIWAGGPEVSFHTASVIREWNLRGVLAGPGEAAFHELVSAYAQDRADQLPALLDESVAAVRPLDEIPFWYDSLKDFTHRIIYYESSRGCPFSCSYCLSSVTKTMDFRSVPRVCRELDFFLEHQTAQVKFVDRTFNCNKSHALPILWHILKHDNGITNFHFEIAADLLDEDYFEVLKKMRPGAVQLEIGVQSTCQKTIHEISRRTDWEKLAAAVRRIRSWHNIHIHLDLIAGLPFEDLATFQTSFNDVFRLGPQQLQTGFLKVLKGSPMERRAGNYDLLYSDEPPYEVLSTRWLSFDDLCLLKQIAEMVECYYNSGQFSHTLDYLCAYFPSPFAMYEALARWYEARGLTTLQPSRVRKYEILLEFGSACTVEQPDNGTISARLKELLTYDLYLREHMKSRPAFACDIKDRKNIIDEILYTESKTHQLFPQLADCNYRELTKQLHGELFNYIFETPSVVLFYYGKRDPLTNNCVTELFPIK